MKPSFVVAGCLVLALSACSDEDAATIALEHPTPPSTDAATDHAMGNDGATSNDGGSNDDASNDGASGDGSPPDGASDGEAGSDGDASPVDGGRSEGGPGGDGGIVIDRDGATADAS